MARDPYKYFRVEGRELVEALGRAALELEKGAGDPTQAAHMLRLAHTLKGAARVVRQGEIADAAHAIEDLLDRGARADPQSPRERVDRILRALDGITDKLGALGHPPGADAPGLTETKPGAPELLQGVRVEIGELDMLLTGVSEAGVRLAGLRRDLDDLAHARGLVSTLGDSGQVAPRGQAAVQELSELLFRVGRSLNAGLEQVDREVEQLRERAHQLRLLPASDIFPILERGVRDAAHAVGRVVEFDTSGGDVRLESQVLFALRDALLHVVRNSVAHGIEPETERRAAGKPSGGRIALEVRRRGSSVSFACRDDGRGIDAEALRRIAVARGIATAQEVACMAREEVLRLALESGVTTVERPGPLSGRGVGLDVLRATVGSLKGDVRVSSDAGRGTSVEVTVPASVSSIAVLALRADDSTFSLPLDCVSRSLLVASRDLLRLGEGDSILVDGTPVPFVTLSLLVGAGGPSGPRERPWSTVVVRFGHRLAAVGADAIVGIARVVVRPLPGAAGTIPLVSGVSLDSAGDPQLLLDPAGIVAVAARGRAAAARPPQAGHARRPILIIDDSLTTRMLEQSILESAGYEVELATCAEEGLAKAASAPHSLFLVDVEMPGMNGFDFVATTRADPALRGTPAMLVSSRQSAEDRRRGAEAGASAYIVKGEFDQVNFLKTIRRLIG